SAVRRPPPDLPRRRRHRPRGLPNHAGIRWPRHLGWARCPRRRLSLRRAGRRPRLARTNFPPRRLRSVMIDHGLDLAVIGNGRTAALVDPTASLVWVCYPRFDGDPIFSRLLAGDEEKGFADVVLHDMADFQSEYLRNTAVVSTVLTDQRGGAVRITDFAPRYRQFDRIFRPPQLIRVIAQLAARPPPGVGRDTRLPPHATRPARPAPHRHSVGSNNLRYLDEGIVIRLTTDAPLSYVEREAPFVLTRPLHLVFGVDEQFQDD